jgi:hypothetical protein
LSAGVTRVLVGVLQQIQEWYFPTPWESPPLKASLPSAAKDAMDQRAKTGKRTNGSNLLLRVDNPGSSVRRIGDHPNVGDQCLNFGF